MDILNSDFRRFAFSVSLLRPDSYARVTLMTLTFPAKGLYPRERGFIHEDRLARFCLVPAAAGHPPV